MGGTKGTEVVDFNQIRTSCAMAQPTGAEMSGEPPSGHEVFLTAAKVYIHSLLQGAWASSLFK